MPTLAERRRTAPAVVRWTAYVGIAIVFAIACAFLSHWQLAKNADRSAQLAIISRNYDATPVALAQVLPAGRSLAPAEQWRPVSLTGRDLPDRQILARNRVHSGTAAYEILVPFRLADGRVFLVDRGWEPPGNTQSVAEFINRIDIPSTRAYVISIMQRYRQLKSATNSSATLQETAPAK